MADLSRPARAVQVVPGRSLDDEIAAERKRRSALRKRGRPYQYWRERGDDSAPHEEFWCARCVGYYGVPHDDWTHKKNQLCRNLGLRSDSRQCACLECVVFEAWSAEREHPGAIKCES